MFGGFLGNIRQGFGGISPGFGGLGFMSNYGNPYMSYMPSITGYQSAIGAQQMPAMKKTGSYKTMGMPQQMPQQMPLQYNPIVQLPDIPKPDPFGFFSPRPVQQQGPLLGQPVTQDIQDYVQEQIQRSRRPLRQGRPSGRLSADQ